MRGCAILKSMIRELWNSFPTLLEQKINGLLDGAEPTPAKAFQLYKTCQRENLWQDSFESFSAQLNKFFAVSQSERRKSDLDRFLQRPLDTYLFSDFDLDFRSAVIEDSAVQNIASWAHHLMRVTHKAEAVVISKEVIHQTMHYITHPPAFEKAKDIKFEDFCAAWKKVVFKLFGKKHDAEFNRVLQELQWLQMQQNEEALQKQIHGSVEPFFPTIYLTQTEIDWVTAVEVAVTQSTPIPAFPLSRGPQKQRLQDLERTISLYKIVQTTRHAEFLRQRDNIKATILDRCQGLLRERAR